MTESEDAKAMLHLRAENARLRDENERLREQVAGLHKIIDASVRHHAGTSPSKAAEAAKEPK